MQVKSAVLSSSYESNGWAVLTLVDEDYEIHTISGHIESLRLILQDIELPNFEWRHASDGGVWKSGEAGYQGRYHTQGLDLIYQYDENRVTPDGRLLR